MPSPPPEANDMDARLKRIKKLTQELTRVQNDSVRQRELVERINREVDAARDGLKPHR
jgi:hypothetical protein